MFIILILCICYVYLYSICVFVICHYRHFDVVVNICWYIDIGYDRFLFLFYWFFKFIHPNGYWFHLSIFSHSTTVSQILYKCFQQFIVSSLFFNMNSTVCYCDNLFIVYVVFKIFIIINWHFLNFYTNYWFTVIQ